MKKYSDSQKKLIGALVGLARSLDETNSDYSALCSVICGVRAINSASFEDVEAVHKAKRRAVPDCSVCKNPCGKTFDYDLDDLEKTEPKIASLKYELIEQIKIYAGKAEFDENNYGDTLKKLSEGLFAVGYDYFTEEQLSGIIGNLK